MVDTRDLKSLGPKRPCGFDSRPRHEFDKKTSAFHWSFSDLPALVFHSAALPVKLAPMALLRYPTPKPPPSGRWLSRPSASKSGH